MGDRRVKQRTDQKTISQPIVQTERGSVHKADHREGDFYRVKIWSIGGVAVINVGNGEHVEIYRGVHGRQKEHDYCVGRESPLDTLASAMDGVKQ